MREFWKTAELQGALPFGIKGKLNIVIDDTAYLLGLVALSADQRQAALTYLIGENVDVSQEEIGRHNIIGTARNLLRAADNLMEKGVDEQAVRIRGLASEANDILTALLAERGKPLEGLANPHLD